MQELPLKEKGLTQIKRKIRLLLTLIRSKSQKELKRVHSEVRVDLVSKETRITNVQRKERIETLSMNKPRRSLIKSEFHGKAQTVE